MIGAGTLRTERYGRMVPDPHYRAWRERVGLAHDPLAVIVSNRFQLPWDAPLFTDGGGRVVVFTASEEEPPETATQVSVVRHEGGVDARPGAGVAARGAGHPGPALRGRPHPARAAPRRGLADELFLTIAPKLAGGEAPRILEGSLPEVSELRLAWLLEHEGELFARYRPRS